MRQFDSRPLKVKNRLEINVCKLRATYCWKVFDEGYNFVLSLISIRGFHKKPWPSKVPRVSILGIETPNLGALEQNDIWM
jgi:hypothetical protein